MAVAPAGLLQVEVVSADRMVWEGRATSVVARTTEGDIGILPRHVPLLAALVPCAAEIITESGSCEIVALDGGFISVDNNRVALISQYAKLAEEITLEKAQKEFDDATRKLEDGDASDDNRHHYYRAMAQLKAAEKAADKQ